MGEPQGRPLALETLDSGLASVAGAVVDNPKHPLEVCERLFEYDEYERFIALLPELLAEYGYPVEQRASTPLCDASGDRPGVPYLRVGQLSNSRPANGACSRPVAGPAMKPARLAAAPQQNRPDPNNRGHRSGDVAVPHARGVSSCPRLRRHSGTARVALAGATRCVLSNDSRTASPRRAYGCPTSNARCLAEPEAGTSSRRSQCKFEIAAIGAREEVRSPPGHRK